MPFTCAPRKYGDVNSICYFRNGNAQPTITKYQKTFSQLKTTCMEIIMFNETDHLEVLHMCHWKGKEVLPNADI